MKDRVIEPSEIIVEQPDQPRQNITHANPWIRFIARFLDYSLFFMGLLVLHRWVAFNIEQYWIPFEFFLWIPIESCLLVFWGTTPGKFFLKTRLKPNKKYRFDWQGAFRRSFSVWVRGLGMGIAIVNVFCLLNAYNKLKILQITSWDRDDHIIVTHHPIGKWRVYLAALIAIFGIVTYYSLKNHDFETKKHVAERHV